MVQEQFYPTLTNINFLRANGIQLKGRYYVDFFYMSESDQSLITAALINEQQTKMNLLSFMTHYFLGE